MKKRTISALLTAFMILLVILIVVLVIKIAARGPKPIETAVSENTVVEENNTSVSEDELTTPEEEEQERILMAIPNTTSSVNVRSGPGTEYDRLGSAYSNSEYVVIEVYSNGWTKLTYDDKEGFISSELLQYSYKIIDTNGNTSYSAVELSDLTLAEYAQSGDAPETTEDTTTSENEATPEE